MARRGMSGQLNMFDFFSSMETETPGEVEMVSLVPDFEEEAPVLETLPVMEEILNIEEIPNREVEILEVKKDSSEVEDSIQETRSERKHENIAMSRSYTKEGIVTEIAYINYNKVRITKGDTTPIIKEFASTKEAVDYYVEQMQELEADE